MLRKKPKKKKKQLEELINTTSDTYELQKEQIDLQKSSDKKQNRNFIIGCLLTIIIALLGWYIFSKPTPNININNVYFLINIFKSFKLVE